MIQNVVVLNMMLWCVPVYHVVIRTCVSRCMWYAGELGMLMATLSLGPVGITDPLSETILPGAGNEKEPHTDTHTLLLGSGVLYMRTLYCEMHNNRPKTAEISAIGVS